LYSRGSLFVRVFTLDSTNHDTCQVHYPQFIIVVIIMLKFVIFKIIVSKTVVVIIKVLE